MLVSCLFDGPVHSPSFCWWQWSLYPVPCWVKTRIRCRLSPNRLQQWVCLCLKVSFWDLQPQEKRRRVNSDHKNVHIYLEIQPNKVHKFVSRNMLFIPRVPCSVLCSDVFPLSRHFALRPLMHSLRHGKEIIVCVTLLCVKRTRVLVLVKLLCMPSIHVSVAIVGMVHLTAKFSNISSNRFAILTFILKCDNLLSCKKFFI